MDNEIQKLLKKYGLPPSKRLGQNFLIDKTALKKIIEAAEISPKDVILEIGPGTGILTKELAKKAKKVIAVEKDQKLVKILKELSEIWNTKNIEIIQGDILKILNSQSSIFKEFSNSHYKVVSNLPYYIVGPVIRKFLENPDIRPGQMVLMVQKEVAQRICALFPKLNLLAICVQFYAKPEIVSYVSKTSFWPQPKVDSAILKIIPLRSPLLPPSLQPDFFKIVRAGFSHPRKQLLNNLTNSLNLSKEVIRYWLKINNIKPEQRAENLSLNDWINLTKCFKIIK